VKPNLPSYSHTLVYNCVRFANHPGRRNYISFTTQVVVRTRRGKFLRWWGIQGGLRPYASPMHESSLVLYHGRRRIGLVHTRVHHANCVGIKVWRGSSFSSLAIASSSLHQSPCTWCLLMVFWVVWLGFVFFVGGALVELSLFVSLPTPFKLQPWLATTTLREPRPRKKVTTRSRERQAREQVTEVTRTRAAACTSSEAKCMIRRRPNARCGRWASLILSHSMCCYCEENECTLHSKVRSSKCESLAAAWVECKMRDAHDAWMCDCDFELTCFVLCGCYACSGTIQQVRR
jgi:hypothetical protein